MRKPELPLLLLTIAVIVGIIAAYLSGAGTVILAAYVALASGVLAVSYRRRQSTP